MPALPCITCVEGCPMQTRPIALPFPNPPEAVPHPVTWPPEDWHAYIACPLCGRLLHRRSAEVRWESFPPELDKLLPNRTWFCVAFECRECKAPMQLCLEMPATASSIDVVSVVNRSHGLMECGHECHGIPEAGGDIYKVDKTIPAYSLVGFSRVH